MFRILQGDVGSGKTIISLLAIANVIESNYQCAFMGPTEILANQHFQLAKKIFGGTNIKIEFISEKTEVKKKKILQELENGKIDSIWNTRFISKEN